MTGQSTLEAAVAAGAALEPLREFAGRVDLSAADTTRLLCD